jgi:hypothetical protein
MEKPETIFYRMNDGSNLKVRTNSQGLVWTRYGPDEEMSNGSLNQTLSSSEQGRGSTDLGSVCGTHSFKPNGEYILMPDGGLFKRDGENEEYVPVESIPLHSPYLTKPLEVEIDEEGQSLVVPLTRSVELPGAVDFKGGMSREKGPEELLASLKPDKWRYMNANMQN